MVTDKKSMNRKIRKTRKKSAYSSWRVWDSLSRQPLAC